MKNLTISPVIYKNVTYVLLISSFFACTRPIDKEPVLATVGNREITKQEFILRAESSPLPQLRGGNRDKTAQLLEILIGEKLMALEAECVGLDSNRTFYEITSFAEELAVARELYLEEVRDKVEIDRQEIELTAGKMSESRTVAFVLSPQKEMSESYRQRLLKGESFAMLLQDIYGSAADTLGNRMTISWGEGEAVLDDVIFDLRMGEVSQVVPTSRGFAVLILENRKRKAIQTETDYANILHRAEKVLRARRETSRSGEFVSDFMSDKAVHLEENVFPEFAEAILRQIDFKDENKDMPQKQNILPSHEIDLVKQGLADRHNEILVRFKGGDWTIGEVINRWRLCNLPLDLSSPEKCRRSIVRNLSIMIRDKFLADEGRKRGYHKRASVRSEVGMWRDHYLYIFLKEKKTAQGEKPDWTKYLYEMRQKHVAKVDTTLLKSITLTDIPVLALRPGQYGSLVVPLWPSFE